MIDSPVMSDLGLGIEGQIVLCLTITTIRVYPNVKHYILCNTTNSTNTLKGVNMEFDIELYDFDLDIKAWVEWEEDPEYSPNEGLYNKFNWVAYLQVGNTRVDITDELSAKDSKRIEKQIEESCDDGI
jgi:hypothetical protein